MGQSGSWSNCSEGISHTHKYSKWKLCNISTIKILFNIVAIEIDALVPLVYKQINTLLKESGIKWLELTKGPNMTISDIPTFHGWFNESLAAEDQVQTARSQNLHSHLESKLQYTHAMLSFLADKHKCSTQHSLCRFVCTSVLKLFWLLWEVFHTLLYFFRTILLFDCTIPDQHLLPVHHMFTI